MLQHLKKENLFWFLPLILALSVLPSCKKDTSTITEEEAYYMADYELTAYKWGFMNSLGKLAINPLYDDVGFFSEGLAASNLNGKWGYLNTSGVMVVKPLYKSAWSFHENFARVQPFGEPAHYIRKDGTSLTSGSSLPWEAADDFSEGMARVKVGNTFGYIDTTGRMVIRPIYTRGWNFDRGIVKVEFEDKLGVINARGDLVLPHRFDQIKICAKENLILGKANTGAAVFDLNGQEILQLDNARILDTDGRWISVSRDGQMFLMDLENPDTDTHARYKNLVYLGEHRWAAKNIDGYILLDSDGIPLSTGTYSQVNKFSRGYAAFSRNDYWGYLDLEGREVVGNEFGLAWDYKEGFARAAFKEGIAFINLRQELAFYPPSGAIDMRDFAEGFAPVQIAR